MGNYYAIERTLKVNAAAAREKTIAIYDLLGWDWHELETGDIEARIPRSAFGKGEIITVSFRKSDRICVESESVSAFQFFDLGKNESNVDKFLKIFDKAKMPIDRSEFGEEVDRGFLSRFFSGR